MLGRYASYKVNGLAGWGAIRFQEIVPLASEWPSLADGLAAGSAALSSAVDRTAARIDLAVIDCFLPPVPSPRAIFCVGLNYRAHGAEAGRTAAEFPSIFLRLASSFVGHESPVLCPRISDRFDYEGELAVIIGRGGRDIAEAEALAHVGGYTCLAENSVRDYQKHNAQVTPGKNFDSSGAIGPWLVSADEIADPADLAIETRLNGVTVQAGRLSDLIFSIPALISYVSRFATLVPGDVIATGTPAGVGSSRVPPLWMKVGDVLEVEVSGVGLLRNPIAPDVDSSLFAVTSSKDHACAS